MRSSAFAVTASRSAAPLCWRASLHHTAPRAPTHFQLFLYCKRFLYHGYAITRAAVPAYRLDLFSLFVTLHSS